MIKKKGQTIRLDTPNTTMVLRTDTAEYLYYGSRLVSGGDLANIPGSGRRFLSTFGAEDYSEYSLLLQGAGGGFAADFIFSKARVLAAKPELPGLPSSYGEGKTVELKYTDSAARVALYLYFTAYDDCDVIAASARVVNNGRKEISIRRLMSLQLDFAETGMDFTTFSWTPGSGCLRNARRAEGGIFVNDSKSGATHSTSAFVTARGEAGVFGADLVYSGNHKEVFSVGGGRSRLLVGMNDFAFGWVLQPGDSLVSPEAVVCFAPDEDALCYRMQAFVGEHISAGKWRKKERPVYVEVSAADDLPALAAAAKEVGAELFIPALPCDGCAAGEPAREGDAACRAATADELAALAEKLHEEGMALGIRIEPETVPESSELCRTRAQYLMKIPGRRPVSVRGRLMLNLADEKVQNYVVRAACDAIDRSGASYVRWDCCRTMTDCFGKGILAGEYFHRYMLGYYRVVSKVVRRFPFVLFEGCAPCGGRLDLGNLCYFTQNHFVCGGATGVGSPALGGAPCAYPQSVIGASLLCGEGGPSDEDFYAASGCLLGYVWEGMPGQDARARIARQIEFYKKNRKLLQFGEQLPLHGEGASGIITLSKDRTSAIAVLTIEERTPLGPVPRIRFKGLLPSAVYEVSVYGEEAPLLVLGGDLLMGMPVALAGALGGDAAKNGSVCRMLLLRKKRGTSL